MEYEAGDAGETATAKPVSPRTEFNPFQTFSYGDHVTTVMDAHFDPYTEGSRRPGRSKEDMETVPRMGIPPIPSRT